MTTLIEDLIDKEARRIAVKRALVPPTSSSDGLPELIELVVRLFECRDDVIDATETYEENKMDDTDGWLRDYLEAAEKSYTEAVKDLREAVGM